MCLSRRSLAYVTSCNTPGACSAASLGHALQLMVGLQKRYVVHKIKLTRQTGRNISVCRGFLLLAVWFKPGLGGFAQYIGGARSSFCPPTTCRQCPFGSMPHLASCRSFEPLISYHHHVLHGESNNGLASPRTTTQWHNKKQQPTSHKVQWSEDVIKVSGLIPGAPLDFEHNCT